MMLSALRVSLLLLLGLTAFAQQPAVVELTSEPGHHLVLHNTYVRVFDVTVPPKATTLIHRHSHDYVYVSLGDADFINARVGAPPAQVTLKDGDARFAAGGFAHAVVNNIDRPFHNTTIELLTPSTGAHNCTEACNVPSPCKATDQSNCPVETRLLVSDQWTVNSIVIPPGASLAEHRHAGPHLVVAVSELHLKVQNAGQKEAELTNKAGALSWLLPVHHTVTNVGSNTVRMVTLEFKGTQESEPSQRP